MYKLTEKKLRQLFCAFIEKFIDYLKLNGTSPAALEKGIPLEDLSDYLFAASFCTDDEKRDGFFIVYKNKFFDQQMLSEEKMKQWYEFCGLKNCGRWIFDAFDLEDCDGIEKSNGLKECYHCSRCKNSEHLLYCKDVQDFAGWMAFNKPIERKRWIELSKMSEDEIKQQPEYEKQYDFHMIGLLSRK